MSTWRKSTLKGLLEGCSWQWALENVYGFQSHGSPQTALGTGYHKAMEIYETSLRRTSLEELKDIAAEAAMEECRYIPMDSWFEHELDPQWVVDNAKQAVQLWWEKPTNKEGLTLKQISDGRKFIDAERHIILKDEGLSGTLDAIYEDDDNYILVDHKTASSFRKWTYEQNHTIEAAVYLTLASSVYTDKPCRFEWHVVSHKEMGTRRIDGGTLDAEAKALLAASVTKADVLVEQDAYRPRPDWNLCSPKWCAHFQGCRINGTLSPYSLTVANKPSQDSESTILGG